jgi:hypothetical protein
MEDHELCRDPLYRRYRFAAEVIGYAVWLYFRFPLSLRMVEEMLAARGVDVSRESVRHWAEKFGREYSNRIRRRAPARGDKWHMDEVVITICGPTRLRARRSGSKPTRSGRSTAAHAQASQEIGQSAPRHNHRQAQIVWRCTQRHGSRHRTSSAQGAKQSGGKLTPADKTARTDHEAIQIAVTGPEAPVHSRSSRQSLPLSPQRALSQ